MCVCVCTIFPYTYSTFAKDGHTLFDVMFSCLAFGRGGNLERLTLKDWKLDLCVHDWILPRVLEVAAKPMCNGLL